MHAVMTSVTIEDQAAAENYLRDQVVPRAQEAPGFVAGYWVRNEGEGRGVIVFESEEAAQGAADRIREGIAGNPGATLSTVTVGEVVASA